MKTLSALSTGLVVVVIALFFTGCDKCKDGCCNEVHLIVNAHTNSPSLTFTAYTGSISSTATTDNIYYYYLPTVPTRVQFFVGIENSNVCTKEHVNFDFGAFTSNVTQDRSMKIFGEVYWGNDDDELILYTGIPGQNQLYAAQLPDIGLKQQFPDGPANVKVFMTVEFETTGTFDDDKAYFLQHISIINASYYYYEYV